MKTIHETNLYVDLAQLERNFNYLKSLTKKNTKIIAVVKAFAYGMGDVEISKKLESLGVDALWVADFDEGVNLRLNGIEAPIIIANPGIKSYETIIKYRLEPVVYNHKTLDIFAQSGASINIHLKLNSGMNRYGFEIHEVDSILNTLDLNPNLNLSSICSHLSSSDSESLDDFSHQQINVFRDTCSKIKLKLGKNIHTHIMNSNGLLRFEDTNDAVRMGIALYGISENPNLQQICCLESTISQLRKIDENQIVGYNNSYVSNKKISVAIIPIGYADGINRRQGMGKSTVVVNGTHCSIIGQISMDSLAIDASDIQCKEGDKVIIFSPEHSLINIAKEINTIPYEIMATLNRRINRIYLEG